jgi:hypothetical protein
MRAVDCWCGELIQAENDGDLARGLREHVAEAHGDEHDEGAVRERIATRAYEPPSGDPPWAY